MGRARRGRWAAMLLAAATGLAGIGPLLLATAEPAWAFVAPVKIIDRDDGPGENFDFNPREVTIFVGDGVTWENQTNKKHTVTSDPGKDTWDSDEIGADGNYDRRFNVAGRFVYRCKIHPKMTGVVVVQTKDATTTTTAAPSTTTTARPTTTTAPPTTTTTEAPTTTTPPPRPPAEVPVPPVPNSAGAATTTTAAPTTTTTAPPTTTTTAAPETTVTSAAPAVTDPTASPSTTGSAPPTSDSTKPGGTGDEVQTAAGRPASSDGGLDAGAVFLIGLLVAVGLFGGWTLIRVRPGRI